MKTRLIITLAALSFAATGSFAKDIGDKVKSGGQTFEQDANAFGQDIKDISSQTNSEILSGSTQMVTGPTGEAVMLVGDVGGEAASAIASQYHSTGDSLRCVAQDLLNPFKDGGCVVQYGGRTIVLAVATAANGSNLLIMAAADGLSEAFTGFSRVMNASADATGRLENPVGAFFVLAYHVTKAGETVLRFALVDVVSRSVLILADEGTTVVSAPIDAMYDVITLHWKRAGVKIINLPIIAANAIINVPVRIIFGSKHRDVLLKTLSPMGRLVNKTLGIRDERARDLEKSRTGLGGDKS